MHPAHITHLIETGMALREQYADSPRVTPAEADRAARNGFFKTAKENKTLYLASQAADGVILGVCVGAVVGGVTLAYRMIAD